MSYCIQYSSTSHHKSLVSTERRVTKVRYATVPGRATALMAHAQRPAHSCLSPGHLLRARACRVARLALMRLCGVAVNPRQTTKRHIRCARASPRARPGGHEGAACMSHHLGFRGRILLLVMGCCLRSLPGSCSGRRVSRPQQRLTRVV